MKKHFAFFAAAAMVFGLAACNKDAGSVAPAEFQEGAPVRLVVNAAGSGATKATGITSNDVITEAKVNSLQVFVFNGDALDGYATIANSTTATVSCTSGARDIYAVVNAPSLASITSKAALLATVSSLENNVSNFQMIGHKNETLKFDGTVDIAVDRLAARVVIRGIKNAIENAAQADAFKLVSIALTNVTGDVNFGLSADYEPLVWKNRRGYEATNSFGSFDYDSVNADLAAGATNSDVHFFYSYPNRKNAIVGLEAGESGFTGRRARLVIKAEIAGVLYNYPIELPVLENNKSYEINLVNITRVGNLDNGSHDPDDPNDDDEEKTIVGFDQGFSITVNDWNVVLVGGDGNITI